MARKRIPLDVRFWPKVDKLHPTGCWIWTGAKISTGYGHIGVGGAEGGTMLAHRYSYEQLVGPIPPGLQLDHLCRVRNCVRPDHLEPVTPKENLHRSPLTLTSYYATRTHCARGHELTVENLVPQRLPARSCLPCYRLKAERHKLREREVRAARAASQGSSVPAAVSVPRGLDQP